MTDPHAETRAAIRPVKEQVEEELLAKNHVVGVDIDEKETGGEKTGELSIVVFVDSKQPLSKVARADRVPPEVQGVKTDVQEIEVELQTLSAQRLPLPAGRPGARELRVRGLPRRDGARPRQRADHGADELPRGLCQQHLERG